MPAAAPPAAQPPVPATDSTCPPPTGSWCPACECCPSHTLRGRDSLFYIRQTEPRQQLTEVCEWHGGSDSSYIHDPPSHPTPHPRLWSMSEQNWDPPGCEGGATGRPHTPTVPTNTHISPHKVTPLNPKQAERSNRGCQLCCSLICFKGVFSKTPCFVVKKVDPLSACRLVRL